MTTKEFIVYKKTIESKKQEIANDKEKAKEFLISIGVLTKGGNLTKGYKNLCTLEKQV